MEKILYGSIVLLLVAVVGIGGYAALRNPSQAQQLGAEAVSAVQEATHEAQNSLNGSDASVNPSTETTTNTTQAPGSAEKRTERENEDDDEDDDDGKGAAQTSQTTTGAQTVQTTSTQKPGTYTMAQVKAHASASSCYTTINGLVYDLTSFISKHPGGSSRIMRLCGIEGTAEFQAQHGGQGKPERELASLKIGTLVQ